MSDKRNPTNADLLIEIRHMNERIGNLEQWKIATDAANAAVERYKAEEARNKKTGISGLDGNLMRALLIALGVIVALVTILGAYSHGQ